jgi:hypothetical protein
MKKYLLLMPIPLIPFIAAFGYHYGPQWIVSEVWGVSAIIMMGICFAVFMAEL